MTLIDNKEKTLEDALINALPNCDRVDILVGYFYFSGFQRLAEHLKNKKVRILVGLEVDHTLIPEMAQFSRLEDVNLSRWQYKYPTKRRSDLRNNYIEAFIGFMNDSDVFDDAQGNEIFDLYLNKIMDGTLEIRKTAEDIHAKAFLLYNKEELSNSGDFPGTVFTGSSNLTYKGLKGQGEWNNVFRDTEKFNEYKNKFEDHWSESNSVAIADSTYRDEFVDKIKPRIWKFQVPSPYELYIRVLHELFYKKDDLKIKTPKSITNDLYLDLEYQVDAIKLVMDKLRLYSGAILADVVGLGKSVIASAVARNLDIKTVIVAPPHLVPQWEDYKEEFGIRGSKVFSSGKISKLHEKYSETRDPFLLILDEAHRYRNEDTNDYKLLHQITRSHPENKVLLLTATPFNNAPKDVFALIKLFQTPGLSTIHSVNNLSIRYRDLIQKYKNLRRSLRKLEQNKIDEITQEIAEEQRRLIEPVIIRRSRIDLDYISRYKKDLEMQNIKFPEIIGPILLQYELGELSELYISTLTSITESESGFIGARYKPTSYLNEENRQKFIEKYKEEFDDIEDIQIAQTNLSKFMKRLLVMRFESSKYAFKSTLNKMIESNELIERWCDSLGAVPIMKKGQLPDPADYEEEDGSISDTLSEDIQNLKDNKGFLELDTNWLDTSFIEDVRNDTKLLKEIYADWFMDDKYSDLDPKLDGLSKKTYRINYGKS